MRAAAATAACHAHRSVATTEVTESRKGFITCTASMERERQSHTLTAASYPPLTSTSLLGLKQTCTKGNCEGAWPSEMLVSRQLRHRGTACKTSGFCTMGQQPQSARLKGSLAAHCVDVCIVAAKLSYDAAGGHIPQKHLAIPTTGCKPAKTFARVRIRLVRGGWMNTVPLMQPRASSAHAGSSAACQLDWQFQPAVSSHNSLTCCCR